MELLILGRGKTGSQVAEVARERKHHVTVVASAENKDCAALTADKLHDIQVVIDFTAPDCVAANIEACLRAGKNRVVGTTGWYDDLDRLRELVKVQDGGFVYAASFSIGVHRLFSVGKRWGAALHHYH